MAKSDQWKDELKYQKEYASRQMPATERAHSTGQISQRTYRRRMASYENAYRGANKALGTTPKSTSSSGGPDAGGLLEGMKSLYRAGRRKREGFQNLQSITGERNPSR